MRYSGTDSPILSFDAIERLEVAIRTQIIYQLSHKYGSHWQGNAHIFNPPREVTQGFSGKILPVGLEIFLVKQEA